MDFDTTKEYTILDQDESTIIEVNSVRRIENWFQGKIKSRKITQSMQVQFDEIEASIQQRDFKTVQKIESNIISQGLKIKELDKILSEIQMGKKDTLYFKVS